MRRLWIPLAVVITVLAIVLIVAVARHSPRGARGPAGTAVPTVVVGRPPSPPRAAPPVRVVATAKALREAIAEQRGHVVLVNFWATYCVPCKEEFPALVQLSQGYRPKGLIVFTVSLDHPQDIPAKVQPFLNAQKADFPQFLAQPDDPETFIDGIDRTWAGDLPRTLIYDRSGRLIARLAGPQTTPKFVAAVRAALAGPAPAPPQTRPNRRQALMPPKPKELERT